MAESATDALENMTMESEYEFETEVNVPPAPSPSNATSQASLSKEGEGTSKKRKRTSELNNLMKEATSQMHEATNQMKKLVSIVGDSSPNMDGLIPEMTGLGLGMMEIIHMGKYFGDKPSQYRFWKNLDNTMKLEFVKSVYDGDK